MFTGGIYGAGYRQLQSHAALYVQATEVGGTHPALVEAMAYGHAVVANDVSEHHEVLGDTGLYFRVDDPRTLTAALERLLANPVLVADLGRRAAARAAERYSWDSVTDAYRAPVPGSGPAAPGHCRRQPAMIAEQTRLVRVVSLVSDLLAIVGSFVAAYWIRVGLLEPPLAPIFPFAVQGPALLLALPIWVVSFYLSGLYRTPAPRLSLRETAQVLRGTTLAVLALGVGIFAFKFIYISRVRCRPVRAVERTGGRGRPAAVRWLVLNGCTRRQVALAGPLAEVQRVAKLVAAHREWGLVLSGLVTDGTWPASTPGLPAPVLGAEDTLADVLRQHVIDELLIVPSPERLDRLNVMLERCHEEGVAARVLLNFMFVAKSHVSLEELGGEPLVSFSTAPKDELLLLVRRALDIVIAVVALIVLSPLFLVIAIAIKVTSPGAPVIFRQLRAGLHGRRFHMLKFRSMIPRRTTEGVARAVQRDGRARVQDVERPAGHPVRAVPASDEPRRAAAALERAARAR